MKLFNLIIRFKSLILSAFIIVIIAGCGGEEAGEVHTEVAIDSTGSKMLQIGNVMFCIPSPVQTAVLIKNVGATYNYDMLNPYENKAYYSTNYQKALNLGIYGADLGYVTIYEQPQDGMKYLNTIRDLSDDMGVSGAFSPETMKKITENIGNTDSLLGMVSVCYRSINSFLKENDRDDVCALIVTGGWIESLHFVTQIAGSMGNPEIINRIGEQKNTLNNIIKLIEPFYNDPQFTELLDQLYDLAYEFDEVEITYSYEESTVDDVNKITTINSKSVVSITEEQIANITEKVKEIREHIAG